MEVTRLPLLHKYVLLPGDDQELTLAKLKYRLCVMEVIQTKLHQHVGYDLDSNAEKEEMLMSSDGMENCNDSGIAMDESQIDTNVLDFFEVALARPTDDSYDKHEPPTTNTSSEASISEDEDSCIAKDYVHIQLPIQIKVTDYDNATTKEWEQFDEEKEEEMTGLEVVEEEVVDEEQPFVQFSKVEPCTDVDTALQILKTRYRLADITTRKAILTWSAWNLADIVHTPYESFWWWSSKLPGLGNKYSYQLEELEAIPETRTQISERAAEIEVLLQEVLEKEQEEQEEQGKCLADGPEVAETTDDEPLLGSPGPDDDQPIEFTAGNDDDEEKAPKKKKRGSIFARMARALRKRFGRRHSRRRD